MQKNIVYQEIKAIFAENFYEILDLDKITETSTFFDMGIDSLMYISIIVAVEAYFGIEFQESDLIIDYSKSFDSFVDLVMNYLVDY